MLRAILGPLALLLLAALPVPVSAQYSIKVTEQAPPTELAEPVRALMGEKCVQMLDGKGDLVVEVWFRKSVPAKATDAQIQNGLTFAEIPESTQMAAMRVAKPYTDYKKQKVKPGVYTLRLARQPMDGDHMGTAPYTDFCLAVPASDDKKTSLVETKALQEMSAKSTGGHPGVYLLFPGGKDAGPEPKLLNKGSGHWVLFVKQDVSVGEKKATIGLGLVLVGFSASL